MKEHPAGIENITVSCLRIPIASRWKSFMHLGIASPATGQIKFRIPLTHMRKISDGLASEFYSQLLGRMDSNKAESPVVP
jgi:hypothetical protein